MAYTNLQRGSTGDDVKKLQTALGVTADGIYGSETEAAVRNYQQQNGIGVDGVAGNTTLSKLYGTSDSGSTTTPQGETTLTPNYNSQYDDQINELFSKLMNREAFSYDAASDPLYQQYKDLYVSQGKSAMQDTMGQAAALTGGYGSSYAQSVGQQQYDAYLQRLNEVVPELYESAYARYEAEGDNLADQYSMLLSRDEQQYSRQQDAYSSLVSLITSTGYTPTAQELVNAGMSEAQAAAYLKAYTDSQSSGSGSGGGDDDDDEISVNMASVNSLGYGPISEDKLAQLEASGVIESYVSGNQIYFKKTGNSGGTSMGSSYDWRKGLI